MKNFATKLKNKVFQKIEPFIFSEFFIKNIDTPHINHSSRVISVAIPHYERGKKIHIALKNILRDERINEIVILDDGSSQEEFNYLVENLSRFSGKIKLFRRKQNLGALANKIQVLSLTSNEWVILLDSDNSIFRQYLDTIFQFPKWEEDTIYCPNFAYPYLDFRVLSGQVIDFQNFLKIDRQGHGSFLNDGNYLVNKTRFLKALLPYKEFNVFAADVVFANYIWCSQSGNKLEVLPNSPYFHRVHGGSTWINNSNESSRIFGIVFDRLKRNIRASKYDLSNSIEMVSHAWVEPIAIPLRSAYHE